ncbi:hypothetical protein CPB85DRAFT_1330053 [Mucidula mucida]|nr:hypothetical protein CPB85DRAFT_1330053 [Mucidula mucida]
MIRSSSSLSVDATCRERSPLSARGRCVPGSCLSSGGKLSQRPAVRSTISSIMASSYGVIRPKYSQ